MARIIVITSGKGGVGKTTLTAGLGVAMGRLGTSVALIEGDIGLNNLDVALGLESKVVFDSSDVLKGSCAFRQALLPVPDTKGNVVLLPSFKADKGYMTNSEFKGLVSTLANNNEYVLIDCPAGIESNFNRAICSAKEAIIVTTPHITSVRDADKTSTILANYGVNMLGIVVNRVKEEVLKKNLCLNPEDIAKVMQTELLGVMPEDDIIAYGGSILLGATKKSMISYNTLAENIIYNRNNVLDVLSGYYGMLKRRKYL